ncbi:MAG: SRPBCC family protein [Lysobacter sp.]
MVGSGSELAHRYESQGFVQAPVERVFAHIDDHTRLSSHMSEPSWKMGGGRMETQLDEGRGQKVGSRIRLAGQAFGIKLSVEEIVTEHSPPRRKIWETMGAPKLLVIGHYRMGFELSPQDNGSLLRVFIEYALPERAPARWLGRLLGRRYARWCTQRIVDDAAKHFSASLPKSEWT